jgi:hypothetical protein
MRLAPGKPGYRFVQRRERLLIHVAALGRRPILASTSDVCGNAHGNGMATKWRFR